MNNQSSKNWRVKRARKEKNKTVQQKRKDQTRKKTEKKSKKERKKERKRDRKEILQSKGNEEPQRRAIHVPKGTPAKIHKV